MKICGEITPPGDKSISHRAFMIGGLAGGETIIHNALASLDVNSTRDAMLALGAAITAEGSAWRIRGGNLHEPADIIDAGNSGTTTRLVSGILTGLEGISIITGDNSLKSRPMMRIIEPLELMGAEFMARRDGYLPMAIRGRANPRAIEYSMKIASAQVKSAILLAGLRSEGLTVVSEPSLSRDHTERMLRYFGVEIETTDNTVKLAGRQELTGRELTVPADPSSAAFPVVWAAATPGSELAVRNVCLNPGRTAFIDVLQRMGADLAIENRRMMCGEDVGDLLVRGGQLNGTTISGDEIPALIDEIPILAVAASLAEGTTRISDARELRVKETDRILAMQQGFKALGATIEAFDDGMQITGPLKIKGPATIKTWSDHRIAMAFHILARTCDIDIALDDRNCVDISFPGFFKAMDELA